MPQEKSGNDALLSPTPSRWTAPSKKLVATQLKKLETSPHLGQPLGNLHGFDLSGYYKLYAVKKAIRLVYRIVEDEVVVEVVVVGKREDFEVYADVARRLQKQ